MATIYEQARPEVHEMAADILRIHHPHLKLGDGDPVKICILMASNDGEEGSRGEPAVKCHGYPAQAVISIIPYKQRVDKRADAEIIIDEANWVDLTEPQQRALLDHEITHLEMQSDESGFVKTDDIGRPKLKLRLHDFQLGGFRTIARRYGADAPEVKLATDFQEKFGADLLVKKEECELFEA